MKRYLIVILSFLMVISASAELKLPNFNGSVVLDSRFYSGDNANANDYQTSDRFQVRKATLSLSGEVDEDFSYALEIGNATCVGSGDQIQLMEAEVGYNIIDEVKIGFHKGHVLRGFASDVECGEQLALEKPIFHQSFSACHPTGAFAEGIFSFDNNMGLEVQLSFLNGRAGTINDEKEVNLGFIFDTPLKGLAVSGAYTHVDAIYYDGNFEEYSEDGYRAFGGVKYEDYGIIFISEYYKGEGFQKDDQVMDAWYAEAGYAFKTGLKKLKFIQPFAKYEFWDKDSDNDADTEYTYFQGGMNFKVSEHTNLKFSYVTQLDKPENIEEEADYFVVRFQTGF